MLVTIAIPTIKKMEELKSLIDSVDKNLDKTKFDYEIICSCNMVSAAINRNWCIDNAKGEIIVMIDDDIEVFENGWVEKLIQPLIDYKDEISIIAPRLIDRKGNHAAQLGTGNGKCKSLKPNIDIALHTEETGLNIVGSACIAFYKNCGVRFDDGKNPDSLNSEGYLHAVYEDSDFAMSMNKQYPNKKICINLKSKIVHLNHGSWRKGGTWQRNKDYFSKKWGITI